MPHTPVLLHEAIKILNPQPGEFFIDGTVGSGGHAVEILKKISPSGALLGIDWDKNALEIAREKISASSKLILVHGNYADLPEILKKLREADPSIPLRASGLLLDLGMSSEQLEKSGRGFSFLRNEPLDMRYQFQNVGRPEISGKYTAADVVNSFSEKDLAEIFWKYGEERHSRKIAGAIAEQRKKKPIKTTFDLVAAVLKALFNKRISDVHSDAPIRKSFRAPISGTSDIPKLKIRRFGRLHPATKVFQALRIYVNDELGNLEKLLKNLNKIIRMGAFGWALSGAKGRVAIISYHSLEDRLVKNYFREFAREGRAEILTKKPIRPTLEEIQANPRSRSAKLRAIILN